MLLATELKALRLQDAGCLRRLTGYVLTMLRYALAALALDTILYSQSSTSQNIQVVALRVQRT